MKRELFIISIAVIIGISSLKSSHVFCLDRVGQEVVEDWQRERNEAVRKYLSLWLKGSSPSQLAPSMATILSSETHIIIVAGGNEETLKRFCLLCGRRFNKDTLPAVLMESRYGVKFDPFPFFEGKDFIFQKEDRK